MNCSRTVLYRVVWCMDSSHHAFGNKVRREGLEKVIRSVAEQHHIPIVSLVIHMEWVDITVELPTNQDDITLTETLKADIQDAYFKEHPHLDMNVWDHHLWMKPSLIQQADFISDEDVERFRTITLRRSKTTHLRNTFLCPIVFKGEGEDDTIQYVIRPADITPTRLSFRTRGAHGRKLPPFSKWSKEKQEQQKAFVFAEIHRRIPKDAKNLAQVKIDTTAMEED